MPSTGMKAAGLTELLQKPCLGCGDPMTPRKWRSGQVETRANFQRRKFCSPACWGKSRRGPANDIPDLESVQEYARTRMTWQYVAGFFDGEGCIVQSWNSAANAMTYLVTMVQLVRRPLDCIAEFLRLNGIESSISRQKPSVRQARGMWQWRIHGSKRVLTFLARCLPYLIVKKVLAQDTMRFRKIFPVTTHIQGELCRRRA